MKQVPGYTLVRTEDCPEQHGTLTVLTHDVSGATILLVENEDNNKAFGIGFGTFPPMTPAFFIFWSIRCWLEAKNTRSPRRFCSCSRAAWHPSSMP